MVGQLSPEEAGWLTSFSESISVSFVCRDASCLWFGRNDQWVIHRDQRHYRCSLCGKFYSPWTTSGGEVPFQKVIAMRSPVNAATMCFGAKWPGSEGDLWLLRQCEAYAQSQAGPRGEAAINAFVRGTATALEELLQRVATPLHFRHFGWNPAIERRLAPGAFPREGPKGWGRLVEGGFWGDVLPNPDVPFEEWTELIPRLGDVIVAARAMSRM
jgi:hypothetical protein